MGEKCFLCPKSSRFGAPEAPAHSGLPPRRKACSRKADVGAVDSESSHGTGWASSGGPRWGERKSQTAGAGRSSQKQEGQVKILQSTFSAAPSTLVLLPAQEQVTATAKEEGCPVYVAGTRLGWFCKSVAREGSPSTSCQPVSKHAVPSGDCLLH